ncbi:PE-PPE domain-containing protein [Rhodococcus erythropolis]|uniref:PE-PPE domain-containing protein n=1 Tax=Rhodococcus erythropolis TaxID=1833 RepID=UPI0021C063BB|nr:PE-PPE domain-containing protein [Rhodococcus erythropolis]
MSVACTVAVTAGVTLVMSVPAGADPNDSGSCPAGAVFAVGGTWDPTGQTTQPVTDRYVAQGYASKPVTYPASFWPLGDQTYDQSVAAGAQTLRTEVNAFHAQCPGSEIVVTGYSQGARIAGDVLGDIARDGSIPQSQVEGVLYADPRNSAGASKP